MTTLLNPYYQIWVRQDQALMGWLLSSMIEPILRTITGCHSSYDLWTALERSFSSHTKAKALQLRMSLQSTKKEIHILRGLGSDYDSVVVNITARDTFPSIEEIYSLLLTHESRLEQANSFGSIDLGNPTANYARYTNRSNNQGAFNRNQNPFSNKDGQWARGRGRSNARRNSSELTCQVCGKYGHSASVCYYRFDKSFSQQQSSPLAYVAAKGSAPNPPWYFDSGATNLITFNPNSLDAKEDYTGHEKVAIGNGETLNITHIGNTLLNTFIPKKQISLRNILLVPKITKNLISISKLIDDNDVVIEFNGKNCCVKDKKLRTTLL